VEGLPSRVSVRPRAEEFKRSSHLKGTLFEGANRQVEERVSSPKHDLFRRGKRAGGDNAEGKVVSRPTFGTGRGRECGIDRSVRVPAVGRRVKLAALTFDCPGNNAERRTGMI
jgi:hypothetical protein